MTEKGTFIKSKTLPWKSHYTELEESYIHYLDEGEGDPVLFLHGNPTSGYLWRNIFPYLLPHARCIIPDLIGMGKSGKPRNSYRFDDHYRYLTAFINAMALNNITLVLHDWGAALGFQYMKNHPDKIKKVVFMEAIIKPWRWRSIKLKHRLAIGMLRTPVVGELLIYGMNTFVNAVLPRLIQRRLTKEEKAAYREPFRKMQDRKPTLIWARQLPIHKKPANIYRMITSYSEKFFISDVPKLLIHAEPGTLITSKTVKWCKNHVRNLRIVNVGKGKHFIQEDHPEAIGKAIEAWYVETEK